MALTTIKTGAIADDAVTADKVANAINTSIATNTAKDLTALSASNLTSGTVPDARFPATLPAASAANLTAVPAANITGTLPAISATNLTNVPAANITGTLPAISGANLTNLPASGKAANLVINGAMQVAQRGTSSTTSGYGSVDRFAVDFSGTDEAPTHAQVDVASGTTPYTLGFRKALKATNGNQTSGAGTSDKITIDYKFEAQDLAQSGWNYLSSSSFITLSFWVKSSVAQNFFGRFQTIDGTQQNYPFETGSLSADTWTKITKTIPGNSNLQFDNNNEFGLLLEICMFRGTDRTGSIALNAWNAYATGTRTPDQTSTWYTTNDATFEITGVQIEVGDTATDFSHKLFSQELQLCKRYYETWQPNLFCLQTWFMSLTTAKNQYMFEVEKRANPTCSTSGTFNNASGYANTPSFDNITTQGTSIISSLVSLSPNETIYLHNSSNALCKFDAEL